MTAGAAGDGIADFIQLGSDLENQEIEVSICDVTHPRSTVLPVKLRVDIMIAGDNRGIREGSV